METIASIILAAGKSKRMKTALPKTLHRIAGQEIIRYPLNVCRDLSLSPVIVVISPNNEQLKNIIKENKMLSVEQDPPLGTGHAVMQTERLLDKFKGYVLILYGDTPLLTQKTISDFINFTKEAKATCGILTAEMSDPASYGRIIRNQSGEITKIVEAKDLLKEQSNIYEINSGVYCILNQSLFKFLKEITPNNKQNEYYLTDIIEHMINSREKVVGFKIDNPDELTGINTRNDLALATSIMRNRINEKHMQNGVTIIDPQTTYIDHAVSISADTTIWPNTHIYGKTRIGKNCTIETGSIIKDTKISDNVHVKPYCVIEESFIDSKTVIGPFARLRPESKLGKNVRIGNFVEIKKSKITQGTKANHLSYIGDSEIGANVNIGCGTITCNYDGVKKYKTIIEDNVFVGSDSQFIAPVKIGKGATIGAGSTITENVPPNSLALSRSKQVIKKDWKRKEKTDK